MNINYCLFIYPSTTPSWRLSPPLTTTSSSTCLPYQEEPYSCSSLVNSCDESRRPRPQGSGGSSLEQLEDIKGQWGGLLGLSKEELGAREEKRRGEMGDENWRIQLNFLWDASRVSKSESGFKWYGSHFHFLSLGPFVILNSSSRKWNATDEGAFAQKALVCQNKMSKSRFAVIGG